MYVFNVSNNIFIKRKIYGKKYIYFYKVQRELFNLSKPGSNRGFSSLYHLCYDAGKSYIYFSRLCIQICPEFFFIAMKI